jgi:type III secretory pathway component EscU
MYFLFRYDAVPDGIATWIATVSWILIVGWLIISETLVLAQQQSISHIDAAKKLFSYLVSVVLLLLALEIIVITFVNGLSVWRN